MCIHYTYSTIYRLYFLNCVRNYSIQIERRMAILYVGCWRHDSPSKSLHELHHWRSWSPIVQLWWWPFSMRKWLSNCASICDNFSRMNCEVSWSVSVEPPEFLLWMRVSNVVRLVHLCWRSFRLCKSSPLTLNSPGSPLYIFCDREVDAWMR